MQLGEQSGYLPEWRVGGAREAGDIHPQKKTQYHEYNNIIISFFFIPIYWYSLDVTKVSPKHSFPKKLAVHRVLYLSMLAES